MTGRSISRPTSSRSLKPSMSGMSTSLITRSNLFLFSLNNSKAFCASFVVVTATETQLNNKLSLSDTHVANQDLTTQNKSNKIKKIRFLDLNQLFERFQLYGSNTNPKPKSRNMNLKRKKQIQENENGQFKKTEERERNHGIGSDEEEFQGF